MDKVRELLQQAIEHPKPPLRGSGDVLRTARRAHQRRAVFVTSLSGLGVVAAVAVGASLLTVQPATDHPTGQASTSPSSPTTSRPRVPSAMIAGAHGPRMVEVMKAAVPSGLAVSQPPGSEFVMLSARATPDAYVFGTRIALSNSEGSGLLTAMTVRFKPNDPAAVLAGGDLCARDVAAWLSTFTGGKENDCAEVVVGGERIRVASSDATRTAVRWLDGGLVVLVWSHDGWRPDLGVWPSSSPAVGGGSRTVPDLSATTLAELARDDRLLP
ncbi:hypothetical protein ACFQO7_37570 [Catellatospora aurea]|uniref:Uncharacterized protein n=1 Tax=Catellatospora aurea TaxID=1337874 RepID=A0ABW2HA41_9ACTN